MKIVVIQDRYCSRKDSFCEQLKNRTPMNICISKNDYKQGNKLCRIFKTAKQKEQINNGIKEFLISKAVESLKENYNYIFVECTSECDPFEDIMKSADCAEEFVHIIKEKDLFCVDRISNKRICK